MATTYRPSGEESVATHGLFYTHQTVLTLLMAVAFLIAVLNANLLVKSRGQVSTIMTSYVWVYVADVVFVLIMLPRSVWSLATGAIDDPAKPSTVTWCHLAGFGLLTQVTALHVALATVAVSTYVLVKTGTPLSAKAIALTNVILGWGGGVAFSAVYWAYDMLGPYRGLYCVVRETRFKLSVTVPSIISFLVIVAIMAYSYTSAWIHVKRMAQRAESPHGRIGAIQIKADELVLNRGLWFIGTFTMCWGIFLASCYFYTVAVGQLVPIWIDVWASVMIKLEPVLNGMYLARLLQSLPVNNARAMPARAFVDSTSTPNSSQAAGTAVRRIVARMVLGYRSEAGVSLNSGSGGSSDSKEEAAPQPGEGKMPDLHAEGVRKNEEEEVELMASRL